MDIFARRSPPAVRARHHNRGKYRRLPQHMNYDYGTNDEGIAFPSIDVPGISIPPYPGVGAGTGSTTTTTTTTTTSNPAELPLHTTLLSSSSSSSSSSSVTPSSSTTPIIIRTTATPTPSPSSDASNTNSDSNTTSNAVAQSKGIPGVAIGLIVAVVLFIVMALIFFLVRRKYISNRQKKRHATWAAGAAGFPFPAKQIEYSSSDEKKPYDNGARAPSPSFGAYAGSAMAEDQTPAAYSVTPPPMSYNNISPQSATTLPSLSPGMGGGAVGMTRAAATIPAEAIIQCTFIPTLPDELSIRMGETVRVLEEYDDGWALCTNTLGERGMVPIECLDQSARDGMRVEQVDRRTSRRATSLLPARY